MGKSNNFIPLHPVTTTEVTYSPLLLSVMLVQNVKIIAHLGVENLQKLIFMHYFAPRLENLVLNDYM